MRSLLLMLASGGAVAFGFFAQLAALAGFGAGAATDAFFVGTLLPTAASSIIAAPLGAMLTPRLAPLPPPERVAAIRRHGLFALLILTPFTALCAFTAPWWTAALAPGLAPDAAAFTARMAALQVWGMPLHGLAAVGWAAAQARGAPLLAEGAPCLAALLYALGAWAAPSLSLAPDAGMLLLGGLTVARLAAVVVFYAPLAFLSGHRHGEANAAALPETKPLTKESPAQLWRRGAPLAGAGLSAQAGWAVDRVLASYAPSGWLSLHQLALGLITAAVVVIDKAFVQPHMRGLAQCVAAGETAAARALARRRVIFASGLGLAAGAAAVFLTGPIFFLAAPWLPKLADQMSVLTALIQSLAGVLAFGPAAAALAAILTTEHQPHRAGRAQILAQAAGALLRLGGFALWGLIGLGLAVSAQTACALALLTWERRRPPTLHAED